MSNKPLPHLRVGGRSVNAPPRRPILVGTVSGDMVHADFSLCMTLLCMNSMANGIALGAGNIKATLIDQGRNLLVEQALKADCSHVLFIDSDMAFKEDALIQLLKHDKDIVGVTYCTRRPPFLMVHHNLDGDPNVVRTLIRDSGVYQVAGLPCGLMLIKTDVFRKLPAPWFVSDVRKEEGEDIYFCRTARDAGFSIWLDVDLSRQVRHCGQHYYSLDDAKPADIHGNYLGDNP